MTQEPQNNAPLDSPCDNSKVEIPKFSTKDDGTVNVECADPSVLTDLFGVNTQEMANGLMVSSLNALGRAGEPLRPMMVALHAELKPRDAIEAMLVCQMAATHVAMTALAQRLMDSTSYDVRESAERSTTRLCRTYMAQMDALKKYRAKAQQTVRVERVSVHEGGQAIVGDIHGK